MPNSAPPVLIVEAFDDCLLVTFNGFTTAMRYFWRESLEVCVREYLPNAQVEVRRLTIHSGR